MEVFDDVCNIKINMRISNYHTKGYKKKKKLCYPSLPIECKLAICFGFKVAGNGEYYLQYFTDQY